MFAYARFRSVRVTPGIVAPTVDPELLVQVLAGVGQRMGVDVVACLRELRVIRPARRSMVGLVLRPAADVGGLGGLAECDEQVGQAP